MCNEALRIDPWLLHDVPDYLKTQEMCNEAVRIKPYSLGYVPVEPPIHTLICS